MAKYLKKFETQVDYEDSKSSLMLPNVPFVADGNTIHYNACATFVDKEINFRINKYNVGCPKTKVSIMIEANIITKSNH